MILVVNDYVRDGKPVPTAALTASICQQRGFVLIGRYQPWVWPLSLWQRRRREQGKFVIEAENMLVFLRRRTTP